MELRRHPWEKRKEKRRGWQSWVEIFVDGQWRPQYWGTKIGEEHMDMSTARQESQWWPLLALIAALFLVLIADVILNGVIVF